MKKIFYIIVLGATVVLNYNCKKIVEEKPLSDGTLDQFYRSKFDADAAMASMYGQFQQQMIGESQFNNRLTFWGEGRSDNMERQAAYSNNSTNEMHFNSLSANNTFADWSGLYVAINRANLNLKYMPQINKFATVGSKDYMDDATLKSYTAQCYGMRAICYFYIYRNWGGAPIRREAYTDLTKPAAEVRLPADSVWQQVINDATLAYSMFTKGANTNVFYIGEAAVCAILMDAYMWKNDYANAIKWAQLLFKAKAATGKLYNPSATATAGSGGASTDLEPTATWKNQFTNPSGSLEAIWSIHWDVSANGCPCMAGISTAVNNTPYVVSTELWSGTWSKSTTDIRPKSSFDVTKSNHDRTWKWYPGSFGSTGPAGAYTGTSGTDLNVLMPMYRLADIYLLYAEALNKTGDLTNALKYLNLVHVRAGVTAYTSTQFTTQAAMEDAILQERQWELFGEGKRWYDLVRTDKVIQVMDPILIKRQAAQGADQTGFGGDKRKYLWPLHRNVLNANSKLVQNPPYSG